MFCHFLFARRSNEWFNQSLRQIVQGVLIGHRNRIKLDIICSILFVFYDVMKQMIYRCSLDNCLVSCSLDHLKPKLEFNRSSSYSKYSVCQCILISKSWIFRTILLMILFSQYLEKAWIPLPGRKNMIK